MRRVLSSALLFASLLGLSSLAAAETPDPQKASAAQALFDLATEEMERKSFATACPKLEEATKLIPDALGARMKLAECYEGRRRLASAWSQYAMVEGLALKANQPERADAAGKRAVELKPKLATLTIEAASGLDAIPRLTITRDGFDVGAGQWGIAFPVDVGPHQLVVSAPGYKSWKKGFEILADGATTTIKVPVLVADATGVADTKSRAVQRPWQRPLGVGAIAVGGASLGVGALLGGLAIGKYKASNESACNAHNQCTDAGLATRQTALSLGAGSTAAIVVGGVLAAGGVVLMLTAPSRSQEKSPQRTGSAGLGLGATLGGLQLEGTW